LGTIRKCYNQYNMFQVETRNKRGVSDQYKMLLQPIKPDLQNQAVKKGILHSMDVLQKAT